MVGQDLVYKTFYFQVLEVHLVDVFYFLFGVAEVLEAGQTALVVLTFQQDELGVPEDQRLVIFVFGPVALIIYADEFVFREVLYS